MALCNEDESNEDNTPKAVIVRDLPLTVFQDDKMKKEFEALFTSHGDAYFTYLTGFRRVIVNYAKSFGAVLAHDNLHEKEILGSIIKVYFKEEAKKVGEDFLKLPQAEKLFLISPPASPPVGWSQIEEPIPVVNYDLLTAVAGLEMPDKSVELISRTDSTPAICVMGCENPEPLNVSSKPQKSMKAMPRAEVQTQRPPIK